MSKFKVVIDRGLCQGHSVCLAEAPEIFRVVDSDMAYPLVELITERPAEELLAKAQNAAEYCPNGVITIVFEDD
jgi:ferredoxin